MSMFPNRVRVVDSEETPEADRKRLSRVALEQMRKIAPTAQEKASMPMAKGVFTTATVKKRLNFDDTFAFDSPTIPREKTEVAEFKAEVEAMKKKLEEKERELERTAGEKKELQEDVEELRAKVKELRQELAEKQEQLRAHISIHDTSINQAQHTEMQEAASKLVNWFTMSKNQATVAATILQENRLWNRENKRKLLLAQRTSPLTLSAEDILDLVQGSVQEFPGLAGLDEEEDEEEEEIETNRSAEMSMQGNNTFLQPAETTGRSLRFVPPSPIRADETSLNSSLLNSSIDYEKDEKIVALEHKNSLLLDRLKLTSSRAQEALLLQEQKRSLESQVELLEKNLEEALSEVSALRASAAKGMFSSLVDGETHAKALDYADRVKQMQLQNSQLAQNLADTERAYRDSEDKVAELKRSLREGEETVHSLLTQANERDREIQEAKRHFDGAVEAREGLEEELRQERQKISDLERRLAESIASAALATSALPTDAGNTTQILHMANNPLAEAHERMMEEERQRKRKASTGADEDPEAKRHRDEEVEILKHRLTKAEKERASTATVHEETLKRMRKFREITSVLTGCQIKVTDFEEGLATVSSMYDERRKEFAFKYHQETGIVDLLDMGTDTPSQVQMWDDEARHYIGERQSVPAFLASITLKLESQRVLDETMVERTHTYSVLHE